MIGVFIIHIHIPVDCGTVAGGIDVSILLKIGDHRVGVDLGIHVAVDKGCFHDGILARRKGVNQVSRKGENRDHDDRLDFIIFPEISPFFLEGFPF